MESDQIATQKEKGIGIQDVHTKSTFIKLVLLKLFKRCLFIGLSVNHLCFRLRLDHSFGEIRYVLLCCGLQIEVHSASTATCLSTFSSLNCPQVSIPLKAV